MNYTAQQYDEFIANLEAQDTFKKPSTEINWVDNSDVMIESIVNNTLREVTNFLNTNNVCGTGGRALDMNMMKEVVGVESMNSQVNLGTIGSERIVQLCRACNVPEQHVLTATKAVANILFKLQDSPSNYYANHFSNARETVDTQNLRLTNMRDVVPATLHNEFFGDVVLGREAFGAETDRVLPDIRVNIAVTLLRFHRSLLDRVMHRQTSPNTVVRYTIPYAEVYDLTKSWNNDAAIRNGKIHRTPMIDLMSNPKIVTNSLRRIVPKKDNAVRGEVVRDGVMAANNSGNLMSLGRVAGEIGNSHIDYTDLIADGVTLETIFITLTHAGKSEEFAVKVNNYSKARLQMQANATDSADRATMFTQFFKFSSNRETVAGAASTILANLTPSDCIELEVRLSCEVNLKHHDISSHGYVTARPYSSTNAATPAPEVTDVITGLTVEITGYAIDAKYSEENLRKSNVAIRSHYRTMEWEIPVGRNFIVDYALNQAMPDFLMSNVTEAISIGQDHRGIEFFVQTIMDVYDRTMEENSDPNFRENIYRAGFDFVAAQQVRPTVLLGSIDLEAVDTVRSSDISGDIRQYVESYLVALFSVLHQSSYYRTQLSDGEKPTYKGVTSSVILENLMSIPHVHNHMQDSSYGETADGNTVEYRRILPSGVVLEMVTTSFDYMRDKIIFFPYRANQDKSPLNFGHNWDYGTYLAHYTPQIGGGVNKRVFANAREIPLVTNPVALYLEVRNVSKAVDINYLANKNTAAAMDIQDMLIAPPDTSDLKGPGGTWSRMASIAEAAVTNP